MVVYPKSNFEVKIWMCISDLERITFMNEEQQEGVQNSWGMPRGLYEEIKYYGFPVLRAGVVAGAFIFGLQMNGRIFPPEQQLEFLIFLILITALAFYLILPTTAGGTNFNAILYFHMKRKKRYYSIDRNAYPDANVTVKRKRRFRR